jgi:hypothetical protein
LLLQSPPPQLWDEEVGFEEHPLLHPEPQVGFEEHPEPQAGFEEQSPALELQVTGEEDEEQPPASHLLLQSTPLQLGDEEHPFEEHGFEEQSPVAEQEPEHELHLPSQAEPPHEEHALHLLPQHPLELSWHSGTNSNPSQGNSISCFTIVPFDPPIIFI